jgi:DNA primase
LDSDWNELSHNLKPEQRVDMRPSNFFYAVKNFKDYFKAFINIGIHIETYFGYINKTETIQDKGIDDLLTNTLSGKEIELINDFTQAINNIKETNGKGKYISLVKISTMADLKLQEYWNLHSAEAFAEFYKDELINLATFKIKKYLWRFNDDGKLELAQPLLDDEMFFERQVRFDKSGNERIEYKFRWLYAYNFLKRRGYGRLMMASGQFIYIYVENGVVQVVDSYQIKDFMIDLAKEIAPKRELADIMDMLYRGGKMYFGPDSLSNIDFLQPKFELAASDYQYMFFQDSYIKITADSIEEDTFDKLKTYVWSDKIKDHKLKIYDNPLIHVDVITLENIKALPAEQQHQLKQFIGQYSIDFTEEALKSDFLQYIIKTSDLNWREAYQEDRKTLKNNHELAHAIETNLQILSKLTAIGYLIHNYFDAANSKAVIAMDAKNSEVGESHGGSGKSLFGDAISKMVNTVVINGKNKKLTDDPFWAEEVTEKTDVVFIDDVRANVDFEFFFPCITGKFVVNPKNGKKFTIPRDQTPKIFIPTNHAINGDGSSFTRRQSFIMFSDFYGDTYSPLDDFGKRMFDEWDYNQWNLFYNISAICIQLYLKYGLIQPPSDKIDTRRLRQSIGENFIIWCDEYFAETFEERFKRKDLFEVYMEKNGHERKYTTPYIFKKKIIKYCQYRGLLYNAHLDGKDEKSNGVEWFTIQKKQS